VEKIKIYKVHSKENYACFLVVTEVFLAKVRSYATDYLYVPTVPSAILNHLKHQQHGEVTVFLSLPF
jgi:hypothetical protein